MDIERGQLDHDAAHLGEMVQTQAWDVMRRYIAKAEADYLKHLATNLSADIGQVRYYQGILEGFKILLQLPENVQHWAKQAAR